MGPRVAAGRAPLKTDNVGEQQRYLPRPSKPSECRLILLQITDVYTLENLAHFQTLVETVRQQSPGAVVKCLLTGDFLSPYLLSSVDRGNGMMRALNSIPLDYITWGNHEADIEHKTVCRHVRNFKGTWINSNMLDHEAMEHQKEYELLDVPSPDGKHTKKVCLPAVLSDDPALYQHFCAPGAFGGATIDDPWETLKRLQNQVDCDLMVPLQHLYVPDDHKTCRDFDFPVIMSGHDHHRVDEVVEGTRLLKPGMNGDYATVLEISWDTEKKNTKPKIDAQFVKVSDYPANPESAEQNERAYDALLPLRNTELASIPDTFLPFSSATAREESSSTASFICSLLRTSLNIGRRNRAHAVDAVALMGGNFRGNTDYGNNNYFSLETLEAEIKADEVIATVPMPGWLLAAGIEATHAGDAIPGWMQYDDGIVEQALPENQWGYDEDGKCIRKTVVTHVRGQPIVHDTVYRVTTKISDLTNGQSPPWKDYFTKNAHLLPPQGVYINIHAELMAHFARTLWSRLWASVGEDVCPIDRACRTEDRFDELDRAGDGIITVQDIQFALRDQLGLSIDKREQSLAEFVHSYADQTGDGTVRLNDLKLFNAYLEDGPNDAEEQLEEMMTLVEELSPLLALEKEDKLRVTTPELVINGRNGPGQSPSDDLTPL